LTATQVEAVALQSERMLKLDLIKLDPLAHLLIVIVIALQIYAIFTRSPGAEDADGLGERSDRELLEATLAACSRSR
jgi:hypothetical protein